MLAVNIAAFILYQISTPMTIAIRVDMTTPIIIAAPLRSASVLFLRVLMIESPPYALPRPNPITMANTTPAMSTIQTIGNKLQMVFADELVAFQTADPAAAV